MGLTSCASPPVTSKVSGFVRAEVDFRGEAGAVLSLNLAAASRVRYEIDGSNTGKARNITVSTSGY
jgi:hypothetical protein